MVRDDQPHSTSKLTSSPDAIHSARLRKSERSKITVDRWSPPAQRDAIRRSVEPTSLSKKRRTNRHQRSHNHGEHSFSSNEDSTVVNPARSEAADDATDDHDAVEVAALVAKLQEGHDKRQSVALDSLSKESLCTLRQRVLDEAGDHAPSVSGQITSLISTSTSLKMVGYYLRAILARLKFTSQNCYRRLARDTLSIKSPADIAAYPALYDLVRHHYPTLGSASIELWLENPIFTADITWTEWKRYLTKVTIT